MNKFKLFLFFIILIPAISQAQALDSVNHAVPEFPFPNYNTAIKSRLDKVSDGVALPYNQLVHDAIVKYDARKGEMGKMLGLSSYYFPLFEEALASLGLPDDLKYLPIVESSLNPLAISVSGAAGLWQFMPTTGKGYGLHITSYEDQRHDPCLSTFAAAAYLKDLYAEFGDWFLVLAAYNSGAGTVRRAMQKYNVSNYWDLRPYLPLQAQNYIPAYIATLYSLKNAEDLGIASRPSDLSKDVEQVLVHNVVMLPEIAKILEVPEQTIVTLNPVYKRKIIKATLNEPKKITLPKFTAEKYALLYDIFNAESNSALLYTGKKQDSIQTELNNGDTIIYVVAKGDNLTKIATKYNVSVQDLKDLNALVSNDLKIGQNLRIPYLASKKAFASN
ncbi:lytic transglycosylase domain-containing protein [Pedobacter flavus]|uniref:Transglycosylase SLT domain-containing protein n=1 Tax=Pedobacter flavus TaxID=3113906 RepID=A0ABU7H155_9SPHI|nr:transglycosylase SLT domain-containing protein [Pedobacter sp. VNH31]MEE1884753.1 transglycosylase SLT domain-containing protein [Pedobacter sp. VNH31]